MTAIELFISYSHNDEALRDDFAKHLKVLQREGIIKAWYDREISAGREWDKEINLKLKRARIILLLISADFIASDYCWDVEVKKSMDRHRSGKCEVIPVILRTCNWMAMPFGKLQALPTGGARPVTDWENRDEAFADITQAIRRTALELGAQPKPDVNLLKRAGLALFGSKLKSVITSVVLIFLSLIVIFGIITPNIASYFIENAKFKTASSFLNVADWTAFFNSDVTRISQLLKNPVSLQVNLIVQRENNPFPDKPYPFDSTRDNSLAVSPQDYYKLSIETIPDRFYLYVYETDLAYGDLSRLLPPENSPHAFILIENTTNIQIPAGENRWRRLKPHRQMTTSIKSIHVLASRWRAKDIESYYKEITAQLQSNELSIAARSNLINSLLAKIYLRSDSNFSCFFYDRLSFRHES